MDSNIPSCHDQVGINLNSNTAISLLLIFYVLFRYILINFK